MTAIWVLDATAIRILDATAQFRAMDWTSSHVKSFVLFNCLLNDTVASSSISLIAADNRRPRFSDCLVFHRRFSEATTMALTATTILQFVMLVTWTCLSDTPFNQKNTMFARFFTSLSVLEGIASTASLEFAPGLFEVLQAATPPTIKLFKSLPTDVLSRWGVYVLVLEKPLCRPRLYISSGTNSFGGVRTRLKQYDDGFLIPQYVQASLDEGYTIVHKGLLCWIPHPTTTLVPINRLLIIALEATFAYMFWAMKARLGDYGMGHICLWDRSTLEYDGLCSHPCLNEGIHGDFDMTPEQLEAYAAEREQKRVILKAENNSSWHYKQMETN